MRRATTSIVLEHLLPLLGGHVRAVGDHVREQAGLGDVARRDGGLRGHRRTRLDVLLDLALDAADQRLDLDTRGGVVGQQLDARGDGGLHRLEAEQAQPLLALDDGTHGAVLELGDLRDLGEGAHLVQLGRVGDVLAIGLALRDERDGRAIRDGLVERVDRLVAADLERHDHLREDDGLPEGDERQHPVGRVLGRPIGIDHDDLRIPGSSLGCRLASWCHGISSMVRQRPDCASAVSVMSSERPSGVSVVGPFCVQLFQDAHPEPLLELEQDADPREVDAQVLGQVPDPGDPTDVILGVKTDVGAASGPDTPGPPPRRCEGCGDGPAPAPQPR